MVEALERAASDSGVATMLENINEVVAVSSFTWHTNDPALLVAERLGLDVTTRLLGVGGNTPQKFVHDSAKRILAGEVRCVALVGAEAMYSRLLARREGREQDWVLQPEEVTSPMVATNDPAPLTAAEYGQGLNLPTNVYPLFENARRARLGWTVQEQREHLGTLWSNFANVAAKNPYAWIRDAPSPDDIVNPSTDNRMVAFPYTKFLMANMPVDMAASFIMTSFEHATALGIAQDRMVFPQCGADANDHWLISDRPKLDDSPAMRALWRALAGFGVTTDALSRPGPLQLLPHRRAERLRRPRHRCLRQAACADSHRRTHLRRWTRQQLRHALHRVHGGRASRRSKRSGSRHRTRLVLHEAFVGRVQH